ncbi:MAG TPA: hypothetical protein VNM38_10070 [Solirubrobacterales bacterium]|nr:hypothetical protein [Solirubrobacterales bacterium]
MHELVSSDLQTKLLGRLRRLSLAGDGLPERMRSTAFAFLGLTAAAGLALVAIFAQLSFPLLSPAPLPSEPAADSSVARAVALEPGGPVSEPPSPAGARPGEREPQYGGSGGSGASTEQGAEPTAAAPAAPTATEPGGGTSGGVPVEAPAPKTAPAPAPAPSSEPAPTTASDPPPVPTPSSRPPPVPARPAAPTPPAAPGNSQSSAAAAHASERGVEASSKSTPEATTSGAGTSGTSSPDASPGNGNGKALGHDK